MGANRGREIIEQDPDTIDDFFVRCDGDDIPDGHYFNKLKSQLN